MSGDGDFTFPALPSQQAKVPLGARASVQAASTSGRSEPQPVKVTGGAATLEHRNKGAAEPLLTRLIYGLLNWMNNVPLEKGYSQVDWLRVSRATPPPKLRRDITMAEVAQHKSRDDAWMVFRNRVYHLTPYLRFHPGGPDILMKAAGKDGTALFMKYHPWVNIDALMEKCLIGFLADESVGGGQQDGQTEPGSAQATASGVIPPPTFSQFPVKAGQAQPTASSQSEAVGQRGTEDGAGDADAESVHGDAAAL